MFFSILWPIWAAGLLITPGLAAPSASEGCQKQFKSSLKPGGPSKAFTFKSNAGDGTLMKRRIRIYLPKNYEHNEPAPVVLAFHGKHRNGTSFETVTQFSNPEFNSDAIVVYPDGIDLHWTGDPWAPHTSKNSDIKFASEVLDHIESSFCVDKRRVYAAGFSNGGGLMHLLACDPVMSTRIAGFTSAAGAFFTEKAMKQSKAVREPLFNNERCKPGRSPIPLLEFHGDEDEMIDYNGQSTFDGQTIPIPEWFEQWARRNGCDASKGNRTTELNDGRVTKYEWECGKNDSPILLHYLLHGIGHTWPTVSLLRPEEIGTKVEGPSTYFDATPLIMDFFKLHELPEKFVKKVENSAPADSSPEREHQENAEPRGAESEKNKVDEAQKAVVMENEEKIQEKVQEMIRDEL